MDILGAIQWKWDVNKDNLLLTDERTAVDELMDFKEFGGRSVVDVTSIGLKRNPAGLQRVAQATGLTIVMGASWYRRPWHPSDMDGRSVESLTDEIVRDVTVGVDGTAIRAGIIGEVGAAESLKRPLSPNEIKVVRASARASRLTGAAISLHTGLSAGEPPRVLDLLAEEGADLSRVIVGHAHRFAANVPYAKQLAQRGVYIQFDLLGVYGIVWTPENDRDVANAIKELMASGYGDRILLSHDVCTKSQLKKYGGNGFASVFEQFVPYLRTQGVTDQQIEMMLVRNPARVLAFAAPRVEGQDP